MERQLKLSADVISESRIEISITGFPSGAECRCTCTVARHPGPHGTGVTSTASFTDGATELEKELAQQAIAEVLQVLFKPTSMREMTKPELMAALQPRN